MILIREGCGFYNNKLTEKDWRKAILHFERAIEIDPDFSLAYFDWLLFI